jgi:hypothetical protein
MPYIIQGQEHNLSTDPFLGGSGDKHYIPLREVITALGGSLSWDNFEKAATAVIGPWSAVIPDGASNVTVSGNGQDIPVTLSAPAMLQDNQMFVPWDFLNTAYGYKVDLAGNTMTISNPNA